MKSRNAWVYQHHKTGSWYVGWYEPDGKRKNKSFGKEQGAKTAANNYAKVKAGELIQGISDGFRACSWETFVERFKDRELAGKRPATQVKYNAAISHFERICKPGTIGEITAEHIAQFKAARLAEGGKDSGRNKVAVATVNGNLRNLKRLLRVAHDWKYLKEVPKIEFLREPDVAPSFVSQEQFSRLYEACNAADRPEIQGVDPADWWRALLVFLYLTGWRVSEALKLSKDDLDLEAGYAITRAGDNKSGKESRVPLHPLIVEHLRKIQGLSTAVFDWPHDEGGLYDNLHAIQDAAGIAKVCRKDHEHNDSCCYFGFHDLRRGFATANAANLSASQVQQLMRHSTYETTQKYINMAEQIKRDDVVSRLAIPELKIAGGA
ncbi:MAG: site-specific integrase [bacterium]|nr:site-specific integrase [bacterium]